MSQLAEQLADAPVPPPPRKGPPAKCSIYGEGDTDAADTIDRLREQGRTWMQVQGMVDKLLGVEQPIKNDLFRYHWRRKCDHWRHGE